jgi:L-amino acid N-acyltransferase YncA
MAESFLPEDGANGGKPFAAEPLESEPLERTASVAHLLIRPAEVGDVEPITTIYNEAILETTSTFDTEPKTIEDRLCWLQSHDARHPVLVGVIEGQVVAWSSISAWSERRAYDATAETSLYVKTEYRGRGIGRALKDATIREARRLGYHTLLARIAEGSEQSLHLNERFGFARIGTMRQVGRVGGRWVDVHILQKMLE